MQISAHGALTSMYRSDVLANNLANYDTDAFKPDVPVIRERAAATIEDGLGYLPSNTLLDSLGAGPHLAPNRIDFGQGPLEITNRPFDLAIDGPGFFLVGVGEGNAERIRLSRDGRLEIDERGRLVQASTGHRVLTERQRPIFLSREDGPVDIDDAGQIRQDGRPVARLALMDLPDRRRLQKEGNGLYVVPPEEQASLTRAGGRILQHTLEESRVNEISTLNELTSAFSSFSVNVTMMTYADDMLDRAINRLGRVG